MAKLEAKTVFFRLWVVLATVVTLWGLVDHLVRSEISAEWGRVVKSMVLVLGLRVKDVLWWMWGVLEFGAPIMSVLLLCVMIVAGLFGWGWLMYEGGAYLLPRLLSIWYYRVYGTFKAGRVERNGVSEVQAEWQQDGKGYYLKGNYGGETLKFRPYGVLSTLHTSAAMVTPVLAKSSLKEMVVAGAVMRPIGDITSSPGNVTFRWNGIPFAAGSRITVPGKGGDFLSTNWHVIARALRLTGVTLEHQGRTYPWDARDYFEKGHKPYIACEELDVVVWKLPSKLWSILGVKSLQVAPATGKQCELYGYNRDTGKYCATTCRLTPTRKFLVYDHEGGTCKGFSGAPITHRGQQVAVHVGIRPAEDGNYAVELYHLLMGVSDVRLKESEIPGSRWQQQIEEFEGPEDYAVDVFVDDTVTSWKVSGKKYHWNYKSKTGMSWFDMLEEEDDVPDSERFTEAADPTQSVAEADFPVERTPPAALCPKVVEAEVQKAMAQLPTLLQLPELKSEPRAESGASSPKGETPRVQQAASELQSSEKKALDCLQSQMAKDRQDLALLHKEVRTLMEAQAVLQRTLSLQTELISSQIAARKSEGLKPKGMATASEATSGPTNSRSESQECPSQSSGEPASTSPTAETRSKKAKKRKGVNPSTKTASGNGAGQSGAQTPNEPASSSKPVDTEELKGRDQQIPSALSEGSSRSIPDHVSLEDLRREVRSREAAAKRKSQPSATSISC